MKKIVTTFLLILAGTGLSGQTTYNITSIPYNPDPYTGGFSLSLPVETFSQTINLTFPFTFYGSTFNQLVISSAGYVSFITSNAYGFSSGNITGPAPGGATPLWSIMCPWEFSSVSPGSIQYRIHGAAPNRRFTVSYNNLPYYYCVGPLNRKQIILYETTNIIEVYIDNRPLCASQTMGILGLHRDSQNNAIVPGHNFPTQWTAVQEAWRFDPQNGVAGQNNIVSGRIYSDNNHNCIYDAGDAPLSNQPVIVNGGTHYDWTDGQGNYSFALGTGTWNVMTITPAYWTTLCPASSSYSHTFSTVGNIVTGNDFADSAHVYCPDLQVDIGTLNLTRCGSEMVEVNYCNAGTEPDTAVEVMVVLHDSLSLLNATLPYTAATGNSFIFTIDSLGPQNCGSFYFWISVGCDTVGTGYCMTAHISGAVTECDSTNNTGTECHVLIASVDPNDKYVAAQNFAAQGWLHEEMIQSTDELSYRVDFQNTGNDTAVTVRIMDTLSTALDPATLVPGASSHFYQWAVIGNVLIIEFPAIMLPDSNVNEPASHGFVKFRVKQVNGNPDGLHILNTAAIYFDQNAPVITSTTDNMICDNLPMAAAGITVSPANYCLGDQVTLTVDGGNAGAAGDWVWSQNSCNGSQVHTGASMTLTATAAETFYVHASSICGETECAMITLSPQVHETAAFSYTTTNGTVTFTDGSSNATSWSWDFGDQNTSSQQSPVHTYTSSGTYTVMLMVTGPCGSDTSTQSVTVLITDVASAFAGAVKLYPNPNAGSFRVEVPSFAGRVEIEVSDLSGRVIHRQSGEGSTEVSLSAGKGYYLLRLRSGELSHALPVVVE